MEGWNLNDIELSRDLDGKGLLPREWSLSIAAVLVSAWVSAAPGGWSASAAPARPAVPGRLYESEPLEPPEPARGQFIGSVAWHWRAGGPVRAWLCQGDRCAALPGPRGRGEQLRGRPADRPLYFRFQLPGGARRAVAIDKLQLRVEYRPAREGAYR